VDYKRIILKEMDDFDWVKETQPQTSRDLKWLVDIRGKLNRVHRIFYRKWEKQFRDWLSKSLDVKITKVDGYIQPLLFGSHTYGCPISSINVYMEKHGSKYIVSAYTFSGTPCEYHYKVSQYETFPELMRGEEYKIDEGWLHVEKGGNTFLGKIIELLEKI
jgi:hypothetical protein